MKSAALQVPGLVVIGCGPWGLKHLRVFSSRTDCQVLAGCDINPGRHEVVHETHPTLPMHADYRRAIALPGLQAAVIATPASTHFEIARDCLERDIDVFCEKPLTVLPEHAEALERLAAERGRVLMVGHIYCFDAGIVALREHLRRGDLGPVQRATSVRANHGPIRQDVGVLYDLGCHDVAIFNFLFGATPIGGQARGVCRTRQGVEDIVSLSLVYPHDVQVEVDLTWLAPKKIRQLSIQGAQHSVAWGDGTGSSSLLRFSDGRASDLATATEPLTLEAEHFLDCVRQRSVPLCGAREAVEVVRTLWSLRTSLSQGLRESRGLSS